jgi:hypothetical protein
MQRSSRAEIRKACSRRVVPAKHFPRVGIPAVPAIEIRQRDPSNFRDLSNAVRHLTYHMCPFANAATAWQWNLEQLRQRWHVFNGLKVLGINHDEDTVTPDELLEYCESIGLHWDQVVVRPNNRGLGEVMTWVPSLELLSPESAGPNEVVFSAHAKGVKYGGAEMPPVIRDWSALMYDGNLDNWDIVQRSLEWFIATGIMRGRYSKTAFCRYGWYYSGAFWWWRLADVGRGPWDQVAQWYSGRELWIGHQCPKEESDCLFLDNTRSPYLPEYWKSVIHPKWNQYQEKLNAQ